jgi:hypothetical protein
LCTPSHSLSPSFQFFLARRGSVLTLSGVFLANGRRNKKEATPGTTPIGEHHRRMLTASPTCR